MLELICIKTISKPTGIDATLSEGDIPNQDWLTSGKTYHLSKCIALPITNATMGIVEIELPFNKDINNMHILVQLNEFAQYEGVWFPLEAFDHGLSKEKLQELISVGFDSIAREDDMMDEINKLL